jgi:retinol dehydrogenase 12
VIHPPGERRPARFGVVTGATGGIGLAMARALAARGVDLLLVGRDTGRLALAAEQVASESKASGAPLTHRADLATFAGVASVVERLHVLDRPIDILLNNAGAIFPTYESTEDGIERTFALDHLATFHLTVGVYELLRRAPAARVVTTSSDAHRAARPPYDDWQSASGYKPMRAYARAKLANILFTKSLAARAAGTSITANCFHPGVVRTQFSTGTRGVLRLIFEVATPFMRSAERGAATGVFLASDASVADVTGRYFVDEQPRRPSAAARDEALAESLWRTSVQLTGLTLSA